MIVKHPRMIIYWHEYFINYRYVGDVSIPYTCGSSGWWSGGKGKRERKKVRK